MKKHNVFALLIAASLFMILAIGIDFNFFMSMLLSVLTFAIVHFYFKPDPKYLDFKEINAATAKELEKLYQDSLSNLTHLDQLSQAIVDPDIGTKCASLIEKGMDILSYIEDKPNLISESRYFLTYYLPKTVKIISSYLDIEQADLSTEKMQAIRLESFETLSYLEEVFIQQNDAYHSQAAADLTLENELLEQSLDPKILEKTIDRMEKEAAKINEK